MTSFISASIVRRIALLAAVACCFAPSQAQAYLTITQSLTSDVWNEGSTASANYADGFNNNGTTSTVELVRFVPLNGADPLNVTYTQGADTFDLASFVLASGGQRGAAQGMKVNGYTTTNGATPGVGENIYLKTESNDPNEGFGAHANWFVTFDLDDIRTEHFGGLSAPIDVTGDFGMWGGAGAGDGVQGAIFVDGVRIDSMAEATTTTNESFDLSITSGQWLTFGIFNGPSGTFFDDGLFQNVQLTMNVVPEPSTGLLLLAGLMAVSQRRRRRRMNGENL